MAGVYHCSPTNSTFFTRCCSVAICDHQALCPKCKNPVHPHYTGDEELSDHERYTSRWNMAYGPFRKKRPTP